MKKIIGLGVLAITMLFSSCNLDTAPTNAVLSTTSLSTAETMRLALQGNYLYMASNRPNVHNYSLLDMGFNSSYNMVNDLKTGIMIAQSGDWRSYPDYISNDHVTGNNNYGRFMSNWFFPYELIRRVNAIIAPASELLVKTTDIEDIKDINQLLGELYGLRALYYHTLNTKYSTRYSATNANDLSVPLRLTVTEEILPRSTQAEVLEQVFKDLDSALTHFAAGTGSKNVYAFNETATKMLKARVELYMENYTDALVTAQDIIDTSGKSMMSEAQYNEGFNSATNPEWIFAENQSGDYAGYYYSFMCSMSTNHPVGMAYLPFLIDLSYILGVNQADLATGESFEGGLPSTKGLTMRLSDSRVKLFILDDAKTIAANIKADARYYTSKGFTRGNQMGSHKKYRLKVVSASGDADVIAMRLAEAYYIAAESAAYLSNDGLAQKHLLATIKNFDPTLTAITQTGDALKTLIANYKFVDMFGEGKSMEDVKRRGNWMYRIEKYALNASSTPSRQFKSMSPYVVRNSQYNNFYMNPVPRKGLVANSLLERNYN